MKLAEFDARLMIWQRANVAAHAQNHELVVHETCSRRAGVPLLPR
jgi:hypothetical protein